MACQIHEAYEEAGLLEKSPDYGKIEKQIGGEWVDWNFEGDIDTVYPAFKFKKNKAKAKAAVKLLPSEYGAKVFKGNRYFGWTVVLMKAPY